MRWLLPVAGLFLVVALGYAVWQILPPSRGTRGSRGDIVDASGNAEKDKVKPAEPDRKAKPAGQGEPDRKTKPVDTDKDKERIGNPAREVMFPAS